MTLGKKNTVKLGFVGAGFMGQLAHIQNYLEVEGCELTALAETRPKLREKAMQRYGFKKGYATHTEMLQDADVDAVIVVTARPNIGPIVYDCLKAGKHTFTEKPMAASAEQARKLVDMAKKNNVIYSIGYVRRHDEGVLRAKQILDELILSKELGEIVYYRGNSFQGDAYCNADGHIQTDEVVNNTLEVWPKAPEWIPEELINDYAWYINTFCHDMNLMRFLLDKTPTVDYVRMNYPKGRIAVFDFGTFSATFEGGNSTSRKWDEYVEIHFEHGVLRVDLPPTLLRNIPAKIQLKKENGEHDIMTSQCNWSWGFRRQAENFVSDVQNKSQPIANGQDAINDFELMESIWKKELERLASV